MAKKLVIRVGDKIIFRRQDGKDCVDVVRELFTQNVLLEPYGKSYTRPAAVLTNHSWTFISNIRRAI